MSNQKTKSFFSKPDEMDMLISYQAIRITWIIMHVVFVASIVYFLITGDQKIYYPIILLVAEGIYYTVKAYLKWNMTRGGQDNE